MTKLRTFLPDDRPLAAWVRDVRAALSELRHGDNVGPLVTFRFNTGLLPITVNIGTSAVPSAVYLARAVKRGNSDDSAQSGNRVVWKMAARGLVISAIDDLTASTDYDATLAIWMG